MNVGGVELVELPEDSESLKAVVRSLLPERDSEQRRAEEPHVEMLRLQLELTRYKRWYYGPRADRLQSGGDIIQLLLDFAGELDRKPVHPDDVPPAAEPGAELRRVRRRKGRRNLTKFESLPVTTHIRELSANERACPCCGCERREIGAGESWQIEYLPSHFERIQHMRKKYACPTCETNGDSPRIEAAAKPETPIDKGLAVPGLLAYIVTSQFSDSLAALPSGRYLRAAGIRDLARHAIGLVRRCGGLSRAAVWTNSAADAGVARGGDR